MAKPKTEMSHPIPLKVKTGTKSQIERISHSSGLSEADVMRMAIERGIAKVEKMFDVPAEKAA